MDSFHPAAAAIGTLTAVPTAETICIIIVYKLVSDSILSGNLLFIMAGSMTLPSPIAPPITTVPANIPKIPP